MLGNCNSLQNPGQEPVGSVPSPVGSVPSPSKSLSWEYVTSQLLGTCAVTEERIFKNVTPEEAESPSGRTGESPRGVRSSIPCCGGSASTKYSHSCCGVTVLVQGGAFSSVTSPLASPCFCCELGRLAIIGEHSQDGQGRVHVCRHCIPSPNLRLEAPAVHGKASSREYSVPTASLFNQICILMISLCQA